MCASKILECVFNYLLELVYMHVHVLVHVHVHVLVHVTVHNAQMIHSTNNLLLTENYDYDSYHLTHWLNLHWWHLKQLES